MAEKEDTQKDLVYEWEGAWRSFLERTLTNAETRRVIRRCCRMYAVTPPRIVFLPRTEREWSYFDSADEVIGMNWQQCNHAIACHEATHAIIAAWDEEDELEDHGPEFMAVYLALLEEYEVAPRLALEASAKAIGLRWTY